MDVPVGSVVVPRACVAVNRNVDFDFLDPSQSEEPAYRISKPASPFFLPLHQFGVDDNDYLSIYQVSADVEVQTAVRINVFSYDSGLSVSLGGFSCYKD